MLKSEFHIAKMDCPSEENLVRMKLEGIAVIKELEFDLENRNLVVYHSEENNEIQTRLEELKMGARLSSTSIIEENKEVSEIHTAQSRLLWSVLIINLSFFLIEMGAGLLSKSMGLVADSLDMLADSFVYGLSLWAVGSTVIRKKKVARLSGYFQFSLALLGLVEVIRRFIGLELMPDYRTMIAVSSLALIANSVCLYLLQKSKSKEAHIRASMIFTSNDVIINSGVIMAGVLVLLTESKYPDLVVGSIVFLVVIRGALRILKLGAPARWE